MIYSTYNPSERRPAGLEREYGLGFEGITDRYYSSRLCGSILRRVNEMSGSKFPKQDFGPLGRVYLDVGNHPEISTNEHIDYQLLGLAQVGNDEFMAEGIQSVMAQKSSGLTNTTQFSIRSSDGLGNFWSGNHYNFSIGRETFTQIFDGMYGISDMYSSRNEMLMQLATYLVLSATVMGAGDVVQDRQGKFSVHHFERLHAMSSLANDRTIDDRPIVNTRNRSYADSDTIARLHVISFDAKTRARETYLDLGCMSAFLRTLEMNKPIPISFDNPLRALRKIQRDPNNTLFINNGDSSIEMTPHQAYATVVDYLSKLAVKEGFPDQEIDALDRVARGIDLYDQGGVTQEVYDVMPWLKKEDVLSSQGLLGKVLKPEDKAKLKSEYQQFDTYVVTAETIKRGKYLESVRPLKLREAAKIIAKTPPEETRAAKRLQEIMNIPPDADIDEIWWDKVVWSQEASNKRYRWYTGNILSE